jgi:hypothetical protein
MTAQTDMFQVASEVDAPGKGGPRMVENYSHGEAELVISLINLTGAVAFGPMYPRCDQQQS